MKQRYGGKKDANHSAVIEVFKKCGIPLLDTSGLGAGFPDCVVEIDRRLYLVEIKNPTTGYGKKGMNKLQMAWADQWRGGPVYLVRSIDDALKLINRKFSEVEHFGGYKHDTDGTS